MIDLHSHSNYSDGLLSPQELLNKATEAGLTMLALTDHDTVDGLQALQQADNPGGIRLINGIEISTRWKKSDIHVLGLGIDPDNQVLTDLLLAQNESRRNRAMLIAEKMQMLGVDDAYSKACELAGHDRIGRPHLAQIIVNEGKARDMQAAFKRFLGRGKPAYIATAWATFDDAVQAIHAAGGLAVLAHPLKYKLTRTKLYELISDFKLAAGDGLEVVSGDTTATEAQELSGLCMRYQLLSSTGSDYHGGVLSRVFLGRQRQLPLNCTPVWHQWNY
ncbi:PHP domain-containing protein [Legionella sp. CNM-4043-24]|uniref:PHP domain-containing protein n=1 Tax=Legionella sp. CNM-4043-24 TaxID=3421646 RepID=UPI00403A7C83